MARASAAIRWTISDIEAMPDDEWKRYEIIDGELFVSRVPGDEHQLVLQAFCLGLGTWNTERRLGLGEVHRGATVSGYARPDAGLCEGRLRSQAALSGGLQSAGSLRAGNRLRGIPRHPGAARGAARAATRRRLHGGCSRLRSSRGWLQRGLRVKWLHSTERRPGPHVQEVTRRRVALLEGAWSSGRSR